MLRGLVFGAAMVVVRLFQGTLISVWQTQAALISIVLLILFMVGVVVWGVIDGRADAAANPDPDRRADLAMTWLLAGLVAGLLSGAVTWLIGVFYKALYVGGLINELTVFAAFTALVVFMGGISGVTLGRWLIDRKGAYKPQRGGGDEDRADTDVFAAVRSDEAAAKVPRGRRSSRRRWRRPSAKSTAPTAYSEEPAYSDEKTAELRAPHSARRPRRFRPTRRPSGHRALEEPRRDED